MDIRSNDRWYVDDCVQQVSAKFSFYVGNLEARHLGIKYDTVGFAGLIQMNANISSKLNIFTFKFNTHLWFFIYLPKMLLPSLICSWWIQSSPTFVLNTHI